MNFVGVSNLIFFVFLFLWYIKKQTKTADAKGATRHGSAPCLHQQPALLKCRFYFYKKERVKGLTVLLTRYTITMY